MDKKESDEKIDSSGIIKYIGPDVEDGKIDTEKLGKALLGLNDAFKKISNQNAEYRKLNPILKVFLRKGSIEIVTSIVAGVKKFRHLRGLLLSHVSTA